MNSKLSAWYVDTAPQRNEKEMTSKVIFYLEKAYKQFGSRVKAVKRKLEEVSVTLPLAHQSNRTQIPVMNAPSPSSSAGSDLELPDAFALPPIPVKSAPAPQESSAHHPPFTMDLDSRITSFLASGAQPVSFPLVN